MKKKEIIAITKKFILIDLVCEFCQATERKQVLFSENLEQIKCKKCNKTTAN